jgi:hypothetical protein
MDVVGLFPVFLVLIVVVGVVGTWFVSSRS